ncbi:type III-A CRISPR-associated protein Cas10/Csm1 [Mangrovibacterium sp.]|uniref:type III-A CRISPR-associated protein Cas10/Csm1 n=1 Tax=Mangrovibacterium sp. TaxID=1961364 RepID=UPI003562E8C5
MNQSINTERDKIYLAALLHDIGKFYQRADDGGAAKSSKLLEHVKNLEQILCPSNQDGIRTHKHVLWTAQFFEDHHSVFSQLIDKAGWDGMTDRESLMHLASGHHLHKSQLNKLGQIIQEADHLSSGMDRTSIEAYKDDQDTNRWDAFKKKRMTSLMENLLLSDKTNAYHLPVQAMSINKNYFPSSNFEYDPQYKVLWKEFENEFKFIQSKNGYAFSETFFNLLQKYTSTIPASTIHFPDVSLFDHLKTTAAIAVCLYDWQQGESADDEPFLMIGGDFSGIQSYIYNIISENAAKNLKGRSFYLKLLADSVVATILKALNLFQANVIYNSGGSFYILAPNTSEVRQTLRHVMDDLEANIFNTHGNSIYVSIAYQIISKDALMGRNGQSLQKCWGELFESRDKQKSKRYARKLVNDYGHFFLPGESGGLSPRDAITGEEIDTFSKGKIYSLIKSEVQVSELTWKQIQLGKKLKEADYWVVSNEPLAYWTEKNAINPANLGIYYYFLSEREVVEKKALLKASADKVRIISINGNDKGICDFLNTTIMGTDNIYGFDFFGGNNFPADDEGLPKSFDQLCDSEGYKRLGVLRMDVDNLGHVFKNGIPKQLGTLSRYAALSRNLDWFFKAYLNSIWKAKYSQSSYIVYSGGDDLFLVGKWDEMIEFAEQIRQDFVEFTCYNPNLSISGGVAIVAPKYPIKRAAEESAEAERLAKNYELGNSEKNAISFMGLALGWDQEFPIVKKLKSELVRLIEAEKLPKSFISKIYQHYRQAQFEDEKLVSPRTYWLMAYDFGRMLEREKDPAARQLIENCKLDVVSNHNRLNNEVITSAYHNLKLWNFAARWAELEYRTNHNRFDN